jgi:methylated-DNA-[protein]-cysteine S-methyltransferase
MIDIAPDFGLSLFDTPIGRCGLAWGSKGIVATQLPEASDTLTRSRLLHKCPTAQTCPMPAWVLDARDAMVALLQGEKRDLREIKLDEANWPSFNRRVYQIARMIEPGETLTYGDIARKLGDPAVARAVGLALGQNPVPIIVPCHRVLAANGRTGGFSANGGVNTKFRMLQIEQAKLPDERSDDAPMLFDPGLSIAPRRR